MKKRSFIAIGLAGVIFCCLAVVMYIRLNDTKYASEREALMGMGLSSEEATELAEIGAIIRKLEAEKLTIIEKNGIYQVVDEGDNVVKKTAGIKGSEISYILEKVQEYTTEKPVSYETMLQDIATMIRENPEQSTYRATYDNGFWLEAEIYWENAEEKERTKRYASASSLAEALSCINTPYPNEVEICSFPNADATPGLYEYRCELRLYTGLYCLQSYMLQLVNIIQDTEYAEIISIQDGCAAAGALEIVSSDEYINGKYAKKGSKVWGETELQAVCKVSDVLRVSLTDPFSNTAVEGHNWTCYTVFRTTPQEVRMYGASYGVTDHIEKPISTIMVDWAGYQFDDAVEEATSIVWGKVKEIGETICTATITSDGSYLREYYKQVKVEVLESLKGDHAKGTEIIYLESGGETGKAVYVYTGVQEVESGQEYIFFMSGNGFALSPMTVIPVEEAVANVKGKVIPESSINPTYVKPVPDEMDLSEYLYAIRRKADGEEEEIYVENVTEPSDSIKRIPYTVESISENRYENEKNGSYIEFNDLPENDAETIACLKLLYSIIEENWYAYEYEYYEVPEALMEFTANSDDVDTEISNTLYKWIKVEDVTTMSLEELRKCKVYNELFSFLKRKLYNGDYDDYVQMLYENGCAVVKLKYTDKYNDGFETLQSSDGEHEQYWLFVPDENDQLRSFSYTNIFYQFAFGHVYKVPDDEVPDVLKRPN